MRRLSWGALFTFGLLSGVFAHIRAVETGREIILEAEGYDPRDVLSGHFARLRYPIRTVTLTEEKVDRLFGTGSPWAPAIEVYVGLRDDAEEGIQVAEVSKDWIDDPDLLVVKARAKRRWNRIDLFYGIERFYAQQAEAVALEDLLRRRRGDKSRVQIAVAVGDDHRMRIKAIIIDGERRDLTWW